MSPSPPPMHSVTSSPVSSMWMPPGQRAERAVHLEEALDLVHDVVEAAGLVPPAASIGVAVHGVADPRDLRAGRVTFSTIVGSTSRILPAPKRVMNESRPGTLSGLSRSISCERRRRASSVGPSFTPIGLRMREAKSTCAPSSWRVRSPTQTK